VADGVVLELAEDAPTESDAVSSSRPDVLATVAVIVVALVLGYLGWILPIPGGSLVVPALIVLGVGAGVALVGWVAASFRPLQRWRWIFAVGAGVVAVLASLWTFAFSLPASLAWDSNATAQAEAALASLRVSAHGGVAPLQPCTLHGSGSVGPLDAPYVECAIWTPEGHFVTFRASGSEPARGIGFTDAGARTFPDECTRHLFGEWWMFTGSADTDGDPGTCPIGYQFQGAP
jgi:hypothetical protein